MGKCGKMIRIEILIKNFKNQAFYNEERRIISD